ncbi:MAG: serine/threonine protein kinase [Planctomycetes bacterium]|nr:serine/threonine protein kinase [Planctomycetota bacterium]
MSAADAARDEREDEEELFLRVVELEPAARAAALADVDATTRRRVEAWLRADAAAPVDFLAGEEPAPRSREGARIGPYHVLERLGEGGMGTVYAARQSFPRREVALKVLREGRVSADALRRFRHEIEVLGRLQHSGVARIYDAGTAEVPDAHGVPREVPYFTMELVRGVPLVRYAREHGLATAARLELLARVCDAVHYAHQRGVIHRDLKPDNVLVTTEESTAVERGDGARVVGQPKVLDFGIARVVGGEDATRQTADGALVGTLASMSPEQVAGDAQLVDVRADVYALGAMLYELVCGRAPHRLEGLTVPQAVRRILDEPIEAPGAFDPALRGDLSTIALKALERDPERRYGSAAELAADLRAFVAGAPIVARADSRLYLMQRSLRRHRAALVVAASFALLLGAFLVVTVRQARESRRLAASEHAARERADADFARALAAVDLLTDLGSERLLGIPAAEPTRRALLEGALELHRDLLDGHPGSADLALRQAVAHYRVAHLSHDLGEDETALREARAARELVAARGALAPDEERRARHLEVLAGTLVGLALQRTGRVAEAEPELRARRPPPVRRSWPRRARGGERERAPSRRWPAPRRHLATLLAERGARAEAEAALGETLALFDAEVTSASPAALRAEHVALLQQSCTARLARGEEDGVEVDLRRALALAEALAVEEPARPAHRGDLVGLGCNLGAHLLQQDRLDEARVALDAAIATGERLLAEHPALEATRRHLLGAYNNRGNVFSRQGRYDAAERDFGAAADCLEVFLGGARSGEALLRLAGLRANHAALLLWLARYDDAQVALESALASADEAATLLPDSAELAGVREVARTNLALSLLGQNELETCARVLGEVRYASYGPAGGRIVLGALQVASDGAAAAMREADAELAARFRAAAAALLAEALDAGYDGLAELRLAEDWSELYADPACASLLGGE